MFQVHKFYKCGLVATNNSSDTVYAGLVRMKPEVTNCQIDHFLKLMDFCPFSSCEITLDESLDLEKYPDDSNHQKHDTIVLSVVISTENDDILEISAGDFNSVAPIIKYITSLQHADVVSKEEAISTITDICKNNLPPVIPEWMLSKFAIKYGFYLKGGDDVHEFFCRIQVSYLNRPILILF